MNAFDRPVPTLDQQTQYMADAVNASGRGFAGLTLTRTLPDGTVKAWPKPFSSRRAAARAVASCLFDYGAATRHDAQAFAGEFADAPLGSEVAHPSGYSFKALPA